MVVGIIGNGVVGGTLNKWFVENTTHEVRLYDPPKGHLDFLTDCEAIFISVPVPPKAGGQDTTLLAESVELAKKYTQNVFIRSTVLPGTNDHFKTISMPEFLTERKAYSDMTKYPILSGECDPQLLERVFPNKQIIMMKNTEAELSKYAHNCFGAMKVTYFNIINQMCEIFEIDYEKVLKGCMITGFIESQHTKIALDGQKGYGGRCFPENIDSFINLLDTIDMNHEASFIERIKSLNETYRTTNEEF
jgi:UDPglucose 6-dehydrogenase